MMERRQAAWNGALNYRVETREKRRRRIVRALWTGFGVQACVSAVLLLGFGIVGGRLAQMRGPGLLWVASLVWLLPALLGGALAGYAAPRIRSLQLTTFGVFGAALFLALTALGTPTGGRFDAAHRWLMLYLTAALVLYPAIGGMAGHWLRLRREHARSLEPRPWGR